MDYADKAALLSRRANTDTGFPEDDVLIPGFGAVRVRGLSRFEVLHIQTVAKGRSDLAEQLTVSHGCIQPTFSQAEVRRWQKVSVAGEIGELSAKIGALSGVFAGAAKAAYVEFEEEDGSEFRLLPSSEVGDDSQSATPGDE